MASPNHRFWRGQYLRFQVLKIFSISPRMGRIGWIRASRRALVPSPRASSNDTWRYTLGKHRVAKVIDVIGAIDNYPPGLSGKAPEPVLQSITLWSLAAISSTKAVSNVSADMGFEATNGWFAPVVEISEEKLLRRARRRFGSAR